MRIGDRVRVVEGDCIWDGVISHMSVGTGEAYVLYQIEDGIKAKWIDLKELERMQEEV